MKIDGIISAVEADGSFLLMKVTSAIYVEGEFMGNVRHELRIGSTVATRKAYYVGRALAIDVTPT